MTEKELSDVQKFREKKLSDRQKIRKHQCIAITILWTLIIGWTSIITIIDVIYGSSDAKFVTGSYAMPSIVLYILFMNLW